MPPREDADWTHVEHWAPVRGTWTLSDTEQRYKPPSPSTAPRGVHGLALSDQFIRDGSAACDIRFEAAAAGPVKGESAGIVLGYQSLPEGYVVAGLGAFETAYAVWEFIAGTGWLSRRAEGSIHNLSYNTDYALEVRLTGQRLSMVVNQVPVMDHLLASPLPGNQLGLYAMSVSPVQFTQARLKRKDPTAFVAMQFGPPYDALYRTVIKPVCREVGFEVLRIDEVRGPGIIFQEIQRRLEETKVVIAEITAPNQNVFYEVGYAHALNKPTILLAERGKDLPFDIRSYRVIYYDNSIEGKPRVEKSLRQHLRSVLESL